MQPKNQQSQQQAMPQQQFTGTHNHIYETLRNSLMQLHQQGVPGMAEVLQALNKAHVDQLKGQQQAPQMPQGYQAQSPSGQVMQAVMGNMGQQRPTMQQPQQAAPNLPQMPGTLVGLGQQRGGY